MPAEVARDTCADEVLPVEELLDAAAVTSSKACDAMLFCASVSLVVFLLCWLPKIEVEPQPRLEIDDMAEFPFSGPRRRDACPTETCGFQKACKIFEHAAGETEWDTTLQTNAHNARNFEGDAARLTLLDALVIMTARFPCTCIRTYAGPTIRYAKDAGAPLLTQSSLFGAGGDVGAVSNCFKLYPGWRCKTLDPQT